MIVHALPHYLSLTSIALLVAAALAVPACAPGAAPPLTPPPATTATVESTALATPVPPATATVAPTSPASPTAPAPTTRPTLAASPSPTPQRQPTPVPTEGAAAAGEVGYLAGQVEIGPLAPVQRVGVPEPTPSPEVCTSRGLTIYQADGTTPVVSFDLQPDCSYRAALKPGSYVVKLKQQPGIGGSKDLPRTVAIQAGKTTRLDLSIDTGIR